MFVVFEGPSGAGKSTLVAAVNQRLRGTSVNFHSYKFPSTEDIGVLCRAYATRSDAKLTLACLIAADFYRAFETVLKDVKSMLLLSDRYIVSAYVYQRMHGVSVDFLASLFSELPVPDITFVLQAPEDTLIARRKPPTDIFKNRENIRREVALYSDVLVTPPPRSGPFHVVSSDQTIDAIADDLAERILRLWRANLKGACSDAT